jgi:hypothetical protein
MTPAQRRPFGVSCLSPWQVSLTIQHTPCPGVASKPVNIYKIASMNDSKSSPLASAYLRFLQLARAVQEMPDGSGMDANETALLEAVVLRWHEGQAMTVREAISLEHLGSPATLHKRITRLREKEMLTTFNQEGDRRAKFLVPTERTLAHFSQLGRSLQQVQVQADA